MSESQFKIPVAYIIFNRPSHTRATFAAIRAQQPSKLFLIADGPRSEHPGDVEKCREVRQIVAQIDWPCEVYRRFSDKNLGCKSGPKTGIDWVFRHVNQAIILEDDCLPHEDFFIFCETLLDKYKDDHRVTVITGNNFQDGNKHGNSSYYFSKYPHVWGWATWKRSWLLNDSNISFWPKFKVSKQWTELLPDKVERNYWAEIFDKVHSRQFESAWDYPWMASVWYQGGLTVTPNVNLVSNIGFGPDATHTVTQQPQGGLAACPLGQITHPDEVKQNRKADRYVFDYCFEGRRQRLLGKLFLLPRRIAGDFYRLIKIFLGFK